ncbi:hypothetical protein [Emticicia agri]|uniref:N-acetyltransferase domain-containing protein n=1 Tax=Emticicia agri TaxID=2492393 RepID=A0A4Q5LX03_9BACT|nr:hypothetical protein [Emticicia agri]RYU94252.1 hypothetical protein EWM59_17685 [Emticicia agri]
MNTRIRKAELNDTEAFIAIKNQLPISMVDGTTTKGGFLLGTDINTYRSFIENDYCLVAEVDTQVIGFGIILKDSTLRASEVWEKRSSADWFINLADYESQRLGYFEQLAFLKGHRKSVLILCYNLVKWVFEQGYETLFTTTVNKPILNLAAIPFIEAVDGIQAGNIDEFYPKIGQINSDIYLIEARTFLEKVKNLPLYPFFEANTLTFH